MLPNFVFFLLYTDMYKQAYCLKITKFDRSCMVFYFSKLKEIYGSSWINKVNVVL